jgi:hypothetical protein
MAVATIVWSRAPRKSATMMPASVNVLSRFVTVYMIELKYWRLVGQSTSVRFGSFGAAIPRFPTAEVPVYRGRR